MSDDTVTPSRLRAKIMGARGEAILQRAPELQQHLNNTYTSADNIAAGNALSVTSLISMSGCPTINLLASPDEVQQQFIELGNFCRELVPVAKYLTAFPTCRTLAQSTADSAADDLKAAVTRFMEDTPFDVAQEVDGRTLLSYCATEGCVQYLLTFDSVKNSVTSDKQLIANLGAQSASFAIVKTLLEAGAPMEVDSSSAGIVGHALMNYDDEQFKYIVSKCTMEQLNVVPASWGWSFIETTLRYGYQDKALTLARRGVDLTVAYGISVMATMTDRDFLHNVLTANECYKTVLPPLLPFSLAAEATYYLDEPFMDELAALGADPKAETYAACAALGRTPAQFKFAYNGQASRLQKILSLGALKDDVSDTGATLLHVTSDDSCVDVLLAAGVDSHKVKDNEGNTPLLSAINRGASSVADKLLPFADLEAVNNSGQTLVDLAFYRGWTNFVASVLQLPSAATLINRLNPTGGLAPLHSAVERYDSGLFDALLAAGANVDQPTSDGRTALLMSMNWDYATNALLEKGANVNAVDNEGRNLLWWAAYSSSIERIEKFLERGVAANTVDTSGASALLLYIQNCALHIDLFKRLADATPDLTLQRTSDHVSPVIGLIKWRSDSEDFPAAIAYVKERGVDLLALKDDSFNFLTYTLVNLANQTQYLSELARELIDKLKAEGRLEAYLTEQIGDSTTLHYAAYRGTMVDDSWNTLFSAILDAAPSLLDAPRPRDGQTPLMVAMLGNNPGGAKILLDRSASLTAEDSTGQNALELCCNAEIARMLVERGAKIRPEKARSNLFANDMVPVLEEQLMAVPATASLLLTAIASDFNDEGFITRLVRRGLESKNFAIDQEIDGQTAVHRLAYAGNNVGDSQYYWLEKLIAAGTDVNLVRTDGVTPLLEAIRGSNRGALQLLLAHPGIEVNKMANGETPLTYALVNYKSQDIIESLINAGADKTLANAEGRKPLDITSDSTLVALLQPAPAPEASAPST